MKISVLTTDPQHPIVPHLETWCSARRDDGHSVEFVHKVDALTGGEILFLVSCSIIVPEEVTGLYQSALVLHASALPEDPGWSPHVWRVLEGAESLTVTLLEAAEPVDSGDIWLQRKVALEGHELATEINAMVFSAELALMDEAVEGFGAIDPQPQVGARGVYRRRRTPADSELDPRRSLGEQFNLLRVVDNERYPAFFRHAGHTYVLKIEKGEGP